MSKLSLLRVVTNRLNSTPVKELPAVAHFLATSIADCAATLKSASGPSAGKNDEVILQIHKLKARLTSLLQDRSAEGRFTAVVLVKATIEAGGRGVLESCEPWVRGLIAILSRPDPVSSKRLCLITITRIFCLIQQYPTIIREVTTPLLPAFVTACMKLGALQPSASNEDLPPRPSPYLKTVLQCMLQLIPHHPSTFRPFASKLQTALVKFIGAQYITDDIRNLAQSVYVALHVCAPKNTANDEWLKACQAVIASVHRTADLILRAVVEQWEPSNSSQGQASVHKMFDEVPQSIEGDPLGLPSWKGIYQGSRMMSSLLHLFQALLHEQMLHSVDLPIGLILDLTSRLLYVRVPTHSKDTQSSVRFNAEIGRDEREELFAILPEIHQSALNLLSSLVDSLGLSMLPTSHTILDQCIWIFGPEASAQSVRLASYNLLDKLIPFIGPSMQKDSVKSLLEVLEFCCKDAASKSITSDEQARRKAGSNAQPATNGHADSFLQSTLKRTEPQQEVSMIQTAASKLLSRVLEFVPAQSIPHSLRTEIDRTAILTEQKRVMLASVLNSPPVTTGKPAPPSVVPFLARASHDELEVEGLLRPRMPVMRGDNHAADGVEDEVDEAENECFEISNPTNGMDTATPLQPVFDQATSQNELLDRLEDSIGDGAVPTPKPETRRVTAAHEGITKSVFEREDGSPRGNDIAQGVKRNLEPTELEGEEQSSKRFRNQELDLEPELTPVVLLKETTAAAAAAATSADVEPDSATPVEAGIGATIVDKGKGRATTVSPPADCLGEFGNVDVDKDDSSDFEMPPLYLKTSSEEEYSDEEIA